MLIKSQKKNLKTSSLTSSVLDMIMLSSLKDTSLYKMAAIEKHQFINKGMASELSTTIKIIVNNYLTLFNVVSKHYID